MRDALSFLWLTLIDIMSGIRTGAGAFNTFMESASDVADVCHMTTTGIKDDIYLEQYDKRVAVEAKKAKLGLT